VTCVLLENANKKRLSCEGGVFGVSLRVKLSFYLPGGFSATAVLPAPMFAAGLSEEVRGCQVISRRDRRSNNLVIVSSSCFLFSSEFAELSSGSA